MSTPPPENPPGPSANPPGMTPNQSSMGYAQEPPRSEKSFVATWLISYFIGYLGVDRFYLGKIGTGILKLITFGGFGFWYLIDLIIILAGSMKDSNSLPVKGTPQEHKVAWIVVGALLVLGMVMGAITGAFTTMAALNEGS